VRRPPIEHKVAADEAGPACHQNHVVRRKMGSGSIFHQVQLKDIVAALTTNQAHCARDFP
jgi:hypothetical protein